MRPCEQKIPPNIQIIRTLYFTVGFCSTSKTPLLHLPADPQRLSLLISSSSFHSISMQTMHISQNLLAVHLIFWLQMLNFNSECFWKAYKHICASASITTINGVKFQLKTYQPFSQTNSNCQWLHTECWQLALEFGCVTSTVSRIAINRLTTYER